jgi:hypothetical protein
VNVPGYPPFSFLPNICLSFILLVDLRSPILNFGTPYACGGASATWAQFFFFFFYHVGKKKIRISDQFY